MAKARVVWRGLDELQAVLRNMPDTMTGTAARLAESHANSAAVDIRTAYSTLLRVITGRLVRSVQVDVLKRGGPHRTGRRVIAWNPLSNIFEGDHKPRKTRKGWNRGTISTPSHIFFTRIVKWRRRMIELLSIALLRAGASRVTQR